MIEFLLSQKDIKIGKKAFKNTPIKEITIPYFIQSIGDEAFKGCNNLFTVLFETPSSVQKIGNNAFRDCIELTNIEIPESVTSIGEKAFRQCISLKKFKVPESVTSIGRDAFKSCSTLNELIIPSYADPDDIGAKYVENIIKY